MKVDTRPPRRPVDRPALWAVGLLSLLAAALRLADLTGRSMWLDEGYTLARLAGSWRDILTNVVYLQGQFTVDFHPPAYFALLKLWVQLAGHGDFALKAMSALLGVLAVPATYVLARRLFGRQVGLLAALFAVLSPPYQWYSQEVRMYSLVPALAALSTYFLFSAIRPRARPAVSWLAWACLTAFSLLTHYMFAGQLLAHLVFIVVSLLVWPPQRTSGSASSNAEKGGLSIRRRAAVVAVAFGAVAAVGLAGGAVLAGATLPPGLREMWAHVQAFDVTAASISRTFAYVPEALVFGMSAADPFGGWFGWLIAALCLIGVAWPLRSRFAGDVQARLLAGLTSLGVIVAVDVALALAGWWIDFRYFILAVPSLHVLMARAVRVLWQPGPSPAAAGNPAAGNPAAGAAVRRAASRALSVLALAAVLIAQAWGTGQTYVYTSMAFDDWRAMAQYIREHGQEGDVLIAGPYTPELVLSTYLRGVPIPIKTMPDFGPGADPTSYGRIWYAGTGREKPEPTSATDAFTDRFGSMYRRERVPFQGRTDILELSLYETQLPLADGIPDRAYRTGISAPAAAPGIAAYEILPGNRYHPLPNLRLRMYWAGGRAGSAGGNGDAGEGGESTGDPVVSVRLLDPERHVWADWTVPGLLSGAPPEWAPPALYWVDHLIPLPAGLPPLSYTLELSVRGGIKPELIQATSGAVDAGDVQCCVRIAGWPPDGAPDSGAAAAAPVGVRDEMDLVKAEYPSPVKPGEIMPVVLTWQANRAGLAPWDTVLRLDGLLSGRVVTVSAAAGSGGFPVSAWPVGELVRDLLSLYVPPSVQPGLYRLSMERRAADGQTLQASSLGLVEVQSYPRTPVAEAVPSPVEAKVGEFSLLGYGLDQPFRRGVSLELHTYWRADQNPERDGTLFLHVIGPDGRLAAQDDNPPEGGRRSTLTYHAGDGIDQVHRLVLPWQAPAGEYRLYAGIYNSDDYQRWPARQDGHPALDDLVFLGSLELGPLKQAFLPQVCSE